ncbi:hypothetical protein GCM10011584_04320 [Nocardioides phosphati]|uniref:DUF1905 domain-containing protein n=1 Tax=Nocardioides phosphati TaxID=1867775 RepID=A0ABQ2N6M7_9ACTN|nr:YdeI/OmpD-associated family protein [Nocardioides phosphati]GGO85126.1 hypothetical protein GCM10011584_04320 [Nocardioides phosphati]
MSRQERFRTSVAVDPRGRTLILIPFDPDQAWGSKPRHPVTGSVDGRSMRGVIEKRETGPVIALGPAWTCEPLAGGAEVDVVLQLEGPQRADLAPDIAAALDANPLAAASFDALARFYRKQWLRWIDSTKRRPDQRPIRIAEMIRLIREGHKERP